MLQYRGIYHMTESVDAVFHLISSFVFIHILIITGQSSNKQQGSAMIKIRHPILSFLFQATEIINTQINRLEFDFVFNYMLCWSSYSEEICFSGNVVFFSYSGDIIQKTTISIIYYEALLCISWSTKSWYVFCTSSNFQKVSIFSIKEFSIKSMSPPTWFVLNSKRLLNSYFLTFSYFFVLFNIFMFKQGFDCF